MSGALSETSAVAGDSRFGFGYPFFQSLWILLNQRFVKHPLPFKFVIVYHFVTLYHAICSFSREPVPQLCTILAIFGIP